MSKRILSVVLAFIMLMGIVAIAPLSVSAAASGTGWYQVTSDNGLRLRSTASTSGTHLATLPYLTKFNVTTLSGAWGKTTYNGQTGWVCLDYAKKVDSSTASGGAVDVYAKLDELRVKFPDGKYWNHVGGSNNPDAYTSTPCAPHKSCSGTPNGCSCNSFLGTIQCHGFGLKIGYDIFGSNPTSWTKRTNTLAGLSAGDIIRIGSWHTIVVIGMSGSNLIVVDGNWDKGCGIDWDRPFKISKVTSYSSYYVLHHPDNKYVLYDDSTAPTVSGLSGALSSDGKSINVSCNASDNKNLVNVTFKLTSPSKKTLTTTGTIANGKATAAFNLSALGNEIGSYTLSATAQDGNNNKTTKTATVNVVAFSLSLNPTSATIFTNGTVTIKPVITGVSVGTGNNKVTWSSSNTSVATVDANGVVTGIKSGSAEITATVNNTNKKCTVTVKPIKLIRMSGNDRVATANTIADSGWKSSGAQNAILANGLKFADSLAGAPLAKALNAPILLTRNDNGKLEQSVLDELTALKAKNVYILGGTGVVSAAAETALKNAGYNVSRIYGDDRFATAVEIAKKLEAVTGKKPTEVFFSGENSYADALSISSVAAISGCPILYAHTNGTIDTATSEYLTNSGATKATILGGTAVVPETAATSIKAVIANTNRIYGNNRFETCSKICTSYNSVFTGTGVAFATGYDFPDALAGSSFAASKGIPVVLVGTSGIPSELIDFTNKHITDFVYAFGGDGVLPASIMITYIK